MSKKLTYGFVKKQFEKEGYKLLTKCYKNNKQKLDYICPKGHRYSINWNNWKTGNRCIYCSGKIKKTIKFVKAEFEKEDYQLLTTEYINNRQKLRFICPKGHKHNISWHEWGAGNRCPYCFGNAKKIIKFIHFKFEKEKYILLTSQYKNAHQKLDYICPEGHRHSITWASWQQGQRCSYCAGIAKPTIEFIKADFMKKKYKLLTDKYINNRQKLDYICSNGHEHSITWHDWVSGCGCPICRNKKLSIERVGSGHPNWKGGISCEPYCDVWLDEEFKESIKERDNYECQNPDCWGTSKKLTIHHIDYVKKNCSPNNLITLCTSCNSRANYNRNYWQRFYINIMIKRGFING